MARRPAPLSLALVAAAAFAAVAPAEAWAQGAESPAAAAEAQFQEGRKLMEAKRYGEACPKFLASYKLGPAAGTLLNLADCYEKNGQLASAWARFNEAVVVAQRTGRADREKTARERAERLEPRLVRVVVGVPSADVQVKLDGSVLDPSAIGAGLPVDPGKHTVEASAPGKKPLSLTIEVGDRQKNVPVDIPPLEDAPPSAPAREEPERRPPGDEGRASPGGTQRTLGIVAAAAGGVGLAVGTFFGVRTSSSWSDATAHCVSSSVGLECDAAGVDLASEARQSGNISTIAFVAGGVLLAGGAVLYLTAPSAPARAARSPAAPRARLGIGPGSVVLGGSF